MTKRSILTLFLLMFIATANAKESSVEAALVAYNNGELESAASLFEQSCKQGSSAGCFHLASMYYDGYGVQRDYNQASTLYKKSCDLDNSQGGCVNLATMYYDGTGVGQNYKEAMLLFDKSCGNDAKACFNLGVMYYKAQGVEENVMSYLNATTFYSKACALDHMEACFQLGIIWHDGMHDGSKQGNEYEAAIRDYSKACEGDHYMACNNLASMYYVGEGVNKSSETTMKLLNKACGGGIEIACDNLKLL